jgi:hypothetical protein
MISGRKYQGRSGFRHFTRWVKSVKQAKFRLPDIQPVYLKKTAQFRFQIIIRGGSVRFEYVSVQIYYHYDRP